MGKNYHLTRESLCQITAGERVHLGHLDAAPPLRRARPTSVTPRTSLLMDEGAKRWMLKTVRSQYWRVSRWYDVDDLIQEGYLTFYRIAKRYNATDRPHLMRLFQVSFTRHLHMLASKRTRDSSEVLAEEDLPECADDSARMSTFVAEAPARIRTLLKTLEKVDPKLLREPYRRNANGSRETYSERLCRLAGIDPKIDVLAELH